jgi:hypothetical protein
MVNQGGVWVAEEGPSDAVPASVTITDSGRLIVAIGDSIVADWDIGEVEATSAVGGTRLLVGQDELFFAPDDPEAWKSELAALRMRQSLSSQGRPTGTVSQARMVESLASASAAPTRRAPDAINGMAITALVLGVVGVLTGLVPILAIVALACGLLGVIFGILGVRRVRSDSTSKGRGLAITGIVLGIAALVLGVIGLVIVNDAFDELGDLGGSSDELASQIVLTLDRCDGDGAFGTVRNGNDVTVDLSVDAFFFDNAGVQVDTGVDLISGLRPGGTAIFEAYIFGSTAYERCRVDIGYAFDF